MGIDVSVNLNAFNFASLGNKRVQSELSVVTTQPILQTWRGKAAARRRRATYSQPNVSLLDIAELCWRTLLICGLVSIVWIPLITGGMADPCASCTEAGRKERTYLTSINSAPCA